MSNQGFCARCFNYVDACDCLNYEYDLEFENDKVIPPPPPEEQPEVGTVWYFVSPISPLSYGLELVNADKLGLGILLNQENLWTLNPPPGDPALYLSIPVERLPFVSISSGVGLGSQYKQLQPWELNYFNFNLSLFDKVKTLAQDLAQCKQKWKPLATACKIVKGISNFFKEWNSDDIPIPDGLLDELSRIDNYVDPAILIGIILSYFPPELVEELNNSVLTAIDYDWVHRHLVDTFDPDIGYEDKKQEYGNAFEQGDLFNTDGSYPFPKPSESIAQGGGTVGQNQASQRQGPDRQMSQMPPKKASTGGVMGMVCNKDNSKCWPRKNKGSLWGDNVVAMTQEQIDREMGSRSIVRPVFDDIIPYDSDDEDYFTKPNVFVNPLDINRGPRTSLFGTVTNNAGSPSVLRYPCMFQILQNPGINQTQFFNYPCCETNCVWITVELTTDISQHG